MDMTVFRSGTGLVEPSPVGPEEGQPGPSANGKNARVEGDIPKSLRSYESGQ